MRKVLALILPVALLTIVFVGPAAANRGKGDRVAKAQGRVGVTVSAGQDERFSFHAKDRGTAAQDLGKVHYRNATAGFSYRARITCVDVDGTTARFGYVIPSTEAVPAAIRGLGIVAQVTDTGKNATARDTVGYVSGAAALATACDTAAVANSQAITAGNLRVKPAGAATSTSKKKHRKNRNGDDD
jgi:hypothetical protein